MIYCKRPMSSVSPHITRDSVGRRVGVWQLCASPEALTLLTNEVWTQQHPAPGVYTVSRCTHWCTQSNSEPVQQSETMSLQNITLFADYSKTLSISICDHFDWLQSLLRAMAARRGGTERVLSKLKHSIDNQNYYEAHQMYRTLYFRWNLRHWYCS